MKRFLSLLVGALALTTISPSNADARPSWCTGHEKWAAEDAICSNPELGNLDDVLNTAYQRARYDSPGYRNKIRRDQKKWLKKRNACGYNGECLKNRYWQQINYLEGYFNN